MRSRARRGEGDRLREEILAAAGRLLAEHGDEEAVSIRMIADSVGVTPPSIYRHFADKDALILAVCEDRFRQFQQALDAGAAAYDDPLRSLAERGRAYVRFGLDHPEEYRVLFVTRHAMAQPLDPAMPGAQAFFDLVRAVGECMDAGLIDRADPFRVAVLLWSGLHGVVALLISKPHFPWPPIDELVDGLLELQLRGLGAVFLGETRRT